MAQPERRLFRARGKIKYRRRLSVWLAARNRSMGSTAIFGHGKRHEETESLGLRRKTVGAKYAGTIEAELVSSFRR